MDVGPPLINSVMSPGISASAWTLARSSPSTCSNCSRADRKASTLRSPSITAPTRISSPISNEMSFIGCPPHIESPSTDLHAKARIQPIPQPVSDEIHVEHHKCNRYAWEGLDQP